ncbi:hypothetical protein JCM5350_007934 [Sporobolomyces pararoseus]
MNLDGIVQEATDSCLTEYKKSLAKSRIAHDYSDLGPLNTAGSIVEECEACLEKLFHRGDPPESELTRSIEVLECAQERFNKTWDEYENQPEICRLEPLPHLVNPSSNASLGLDTTGGHNMARVMIELNNSTECLQFLQKVEKVTVGQLWKLKLKGEPSSYQLSAMLLFTSSNLFAWLNSLTIDPLETIVVEKLLPRLTTYKPFPSLEHLALQKSPFTPCFTDGHLVLLARFLDSVSTPGHSLKTLNVNWEFVGSEVKKSAGRLVCKSLIYKRDDELDGDDAYERSNPLEIVLSRWLDGGGGLLEVDYESVTIKSEILGDGLLDCTPGNDNYAVEPTLTEIVQGSNFPSSLRYIDLSFTNIYFTKGNLLDLVVKLPNSGEIDVKGSSDKLASSGIEDKETVKVSSKHTGSSFRLFKKGPRCDLPLSRI